MTRKKGPPGPGPGPGSSTEQRQSPNAATLPGYLDPEGACGEIWVALMKPEEEGKTLPTNPFTIAKSIHATVGTVHSVYRNRDGNLVVKVRGEAKLKKLLKMKQLIGNETKVTVEEHPTLNRTKVVVTCRSVEGMSEEELKSEPTLQAQGVVDIRRFKKSGKDTNTMTITVRGTVAPKAIFFGFERCEAKPYNQAPMQCYRCFNYGHTKSNCKATEDVCRNCSTVHPIVKDDEGKTVCSKPPRCLHCNGDHSPASRFCDQYREEEEVLRIRNTLGKSPREARIYVEEQKRLKANSYAKITAGQKSVQDRIAAAQQQQQQQTQQQQQQSDEIRKLRKELDQTKKALQEATLVIQNLKRGKNTDVSSEEESDEVDSDSDEEMKTDDQTTETSQKTPTNNDGAKPTSRNSEKTKRKLSESSDDRLTGNSDEEAPRSRKPDLKTPKNTTASKTNKGKGKPKPSENDIKKRK